MFVYLAVSMMCLTSVSERSIGLEVDPITRYFHISHPVPDDAPKEITIAGLARAPLDRKSFVARKVE